MQVVSALGVVGLKWREAVVYPAVLTVSLAVSAWVVKGCEGWA